MNNRIPVGGVTMPIMQLRTKTMPNCRSGTPYWRAIGTSSGASMMISAVASITVPRASSATATSVMNMMGSVVMVTR